MSTGTSVTLHRLIKMLHGRNSLNFASNRCGQTCRSRFELKAHCVLDL
uniref:Uncharacterized protein n=1 Tax=Anguilla anguilla TaxID=7936 RepID=A0A0E9W439_ANGAN